MKLLSIIIVIFVLPLSAIADSLSGVVLPCEGEVPAKKFERALGTPPGIVKGKLETDATHIFVNSFPVENDHPICSIPIVNKEFSAALPQGQYILRVVDKEYIAKQNGNATAELTTAIVKVYSKKVATLSFEVRRMTIGKASDVGVRDIEDKILLTSEPKDKVNNGPVAEEPHEEVPNVENKPSAEIEEIQSIETKLIESGQSNFMDVRLNFTLTNENVFVKPGETIPSVPGWRFGRPNQLGVLFFDNYDTRFSGYETLSHAVMYKRVEEGRYDFEGALVIRVNDLAQDNIQLSDAGSYLRFVYWIDKERQANSRRLSVVAFPTSSDRMRLGYSYRLSWGGSPTYNRSQTAVPGLKIQYNAGNYYAYVGGKSAVVLDRATAEEESVLGFLAGAGIDFNDNVRFEVNGGIFDRGANELQDVITERVILSGASAQLVVRDGMPIGSSIDFTLYRNDPLRVQRLFRQTEYPGGLSWLVSAEATALAQTLKDPQVTGGTTNQIATAGDINARVKINRTRLRLDLQYRDLAYILHTTPSLPTFSDFPSQYEQTPNFFAAVGADHNWNDFFTLGLVAGIDMPATLKTPTGVIPGDTVNGSGTSTAVIRNEGDITILPANESAVPQFATKMTARLDFAKYFSAIADIYYAFDGNQTRLERTGPGGLFERRFGEFNQLGFNFTLQARF